MERGIYEEDGSLESRPGVLFIGSPNVGKRTIISALLSVDIPDASDLSGGILCQGWTINTKYYSADISLWTAHLTEAFSFGALPIHKQLTGLVMVFDMSDESSFLALKDWVANIDLEKFEILLCMGNKADLVPGHSAHAVYRRYLQKFGESSSDPHPEFWDYGIDEAEGCSLLGEEEPLVDIRRSCLEWCVQHNIEYVEACASNAQFDKCLSVNGDIQGVPRLFGALSAYMWPGMVMKSGEAITAPSLINDKEENSDEESEYEFEYEVLSRGSDEPWEFVGASTNGLPSTSRAEGFVEEDQFTARNSPDIKPEKNGHTGESKELEKLDGDKLISEVEGGEDARVDAVESDEDTHYGHGDMERLMCEIGNMRDNLRLVPDFQRREMAAKLAMKMAAMFGDISDEDETHL